MVDLPGLRLAKDITLLDPTSAARRLSLRIHNKVRCIYNKVHGPQCGLHPAAANAMSSRSSLTVEPG
jgi:hypothetical protein